MRWLNSFSLVMRSSVTQLREKFEDPERMLHQLLIDMEEESERVRDSVAEAIADEIQLGKKAKQARDEAALWLDRATKAVGRGDEAAAKSALDQKGRSEQQAQTLEAEYEKQKQQTEKLRRSVSDLEEKIRQARQKQTLLLARYTRAESATKINRAMERTRGRSAFAQFSRLEARVDRAEAMEEAYDRLDGRDPDAEELARQAEEADRKEKLEQEFEELKRRVEPQS